MYSLFLIVPWNTAQVYFHLCIRCHPSDQAQNTLYFLSYNSAIVSSRPLPCGRLEMSFSKSHLSAGSPLSEVVILPPTPLQKYSYAVGDDKTRHHAWSHDTRKEMLSVSIKSLSASVGGSQNENRMYFVVMAGNQTMERLDIQLLTCWTREYEQRRSQGLLSAQMESPVQVVVKSPCIALRYPGDPPMIRRFQIKFGTDSEYTKVKNLLKEIGFSIKESSGPPMPASRAGTATPALGAGYAASPSPALPNWQQSSHVHNSSQFVSPADLQKPHFQSSFPDRSESASASSMRVPTIFSPGPDRMRSSSALGSLNEYSSSGDYRIQLPPARSTNTPPTYNFNSSAHGGPVASEFRNSPHPQASQGSQPLAITSYGIEQDTPSFRDQSFGDRRVSFFEPKAPLPLEKNTSLDRGAVSQYFVDGTQLKRAATAHQSQPRSQQSYEPLGHIRHHSELHDLPRPMSTPITGPHYDTSQLDTSAWIPPRRDLPFPKAKDVKKSEPSKLAQVQNASPPHPTSLLAAVPVARTPPPVTVAKQAKKRAAPRKKINTAAISEAREIPDSQEKSPPGAKEVSATAVEPESPIAAKSAIIIRTATAPILPRLKVAAPAARKRSAEKPLVQKVVKKPKMIDSSTQTQNPAGKDHVALPRTSPIVPLMPATMASASTVVSAEPGPPTQPQPSAAELDSVGAAMEDWVNRFAKPAKPLEIHELPGWDTATEEERRHIVEDWMCQQLEDPNFIELCKTLEDVWQRTGMEP